MDELIRLMRSTKRGRANGYLGDFRLSLVVLTGVDKGSNIEPWINWYGDAKRTLVVSEKFPDLAKNHERKWTKFWGETASKSSSKKKDRKKRKADEDES